MSYLPFLLDDPRPMLTLDIYDITCASMVEKTVVFVFVCVLSSVANTQTETGRKKITSVSDNIVSFRYMPVVFLSLAVSCSFSSHSVTV